MSDKYKCLFFLILKGVYFISKRKIRTSNLFKRTEIRLLNFFFKVA